MARATRSMRLLLLAVAFTSRCAYGISAANIDAGFAQDGVTTYCQGVRGAVAAANPLAFLELHAHSAGRCPIDVKLDIKATTVGLQSPMDVQWVASVHSPGGDVPGNIFPRAVDTATKKPQPVIASMLRACKAGTNCALNNIVVPQVVSGSTNTETGAFDAQNRKPLRAHRFVFPSPGQYVVVGIVVLPGDGALNVSASQFIAFQRITVVDGVGPATVSPPLQMVRGSNGSTSERDIDGEGKTDNINFLSNLAKTSTASGDNSTDQLESGSALASATAAAAATRNPNGVDASFSGTKSNTNTNSSGNTSGGGSNNLLLVGGVVVLGVVAVGALVFIIVARNRRSAMKNADPRKPLDPHSEAGIYRLTIAGRGDGMPSSLSMGTGGSGPLGYKLSTYSSQQALAPPRFTNPGCGTVNSSCAADSDPFGGGSRAPSNQFPSFESAALAAGPLGNHHTTTTTISAVPRQQSIVSLASSTFSDYDDLHDSSETTKRPSAASSYADHGAGSYSDYRMSSRIYSEASMSYSDYASSEARSTELGALSEHSTTAGKDMI